MNTLSEQLKSDIPDVDLVLAKKIIDSYISFNLKRKNLYCDICGAKRKAEDFRFQSPYDFLNTCKAHRKYKGWFDVWKVRKIENVKFTGFNDL